MSRNPARSSIASTLLLAGTVAALLPVASAGAAPSTACRSTAGLLPTLGLWDPYGSDLTDPVDGGIYGEVYGVGTGLAEDAVTLRVASRRGVPSRWALCADGRLIADLPVQRVRGARVLGLSVNGRRVAWRTSLPRGRGAVYVARVDGRRLRVERRTTNRAIRSERRVNGRIVVMADGTTAWSLPDRGRGAVWLWPAGKPARRVARVDTDDVDEQSWDVRIVDDGHVFVGATERLASYGRPTPGTCPRPNGSRAFELAGSRLFVVDGGSVGADETSSWSWMVVCDRPSGRTLRPQLYEGGTARYNNSSFADPRIAYKTAGVVVVHGVVRGNADGFIVQTPTTAIFSAAPERTFSSGTPAGPGIGPLPPGTPASSDGAPRVAGPTVRLLPGAAAWIVDREGPDGGVAAREVWLADTSGVRRVATVPNATPTLIDGPGVDLQLTPTTVSWNGPAVREQAPVVPRPNDPIHRRTLSPAD